MQPTNDLWGVMSESEGGLAAHVGRIVELRYADGAITRGKLLDIDPDDREELLANGAPLSVRMRSGSP
jgi:hypothetical protein